MNFRVVLRLIGFVMLFDSAFMAVPLVISLFHSENDTFYFLFIEIVLLILGLLFTKVLKVKSNELTFKDGLAVVTLSWIAISFFGALPYFFSGYIPNFMDALFESVSGFTTTGATVLSDIESLSQALSFWRCFSHWIGGMGVLIFVLAIVPSMKASTIHLLRVETTGPSPTKYVPKIRETAKKMYLIYFILTVICTLMLIISGMPVFDSILHAMSIAGTGGFSYKTLSMGFYNNPAAEVVSTIFMLVFSVNFVLYHFVLMKNFKMFYKNEELRAFLVIVFVSMIIIIFNTLPYYGSLTESIRHSTFQVSSIISTTGFSTTDYDCWPTLSKTVLFFLMIVGCCAGSTGGGIKVIRLIILIKSSILEINKKTYSGLVSSVKINSKRVPEEVIKDVFLFLFLYFAVFMVSLAVVSLDNKDILSSITSVITTLGNVGPGFGIVGPLGNFGSFSDLSKLVFSFCMILGRLEILPVLILCKPSVWRK